MLSRFEQTRLEQRLQKFASMGVGEDLAKTIAMLRPLVATADIGDLAREAGWPEPSMARLYHQVGAAFDFDRLRAAAGMVPSVDHFDRLAVRRLIEDLMSEQVMLTRAVARSANINAGASEAMPSPSPKGGSVGGPSGSPVIAANPLIASACVPKPGRVE